MGIDENISKRIGELLKEYEQCSKDLCFEEVLMDSALSKRLEKRIKEITPIKTQYEKYISLITKYEILKNNQTSNNHDLTNLEKEIKDEAENLTKLIILFDAENEKATIEIDPLSNQNNIFAKDIFMAYQNYCKNNQYELNEVHGSENVYKMNIVGKNCFMQFVSENGVHTRDLCSVFVLVYPTINKSIASFDEKDIKTDVYRSNGAGGQNVNKVSTAIRMKHLPTNIVVTCQDERSQFQNRERAYANLKERVIQYIEDTYNENVAKQKKKYSKKSIVKKYDYRNGIITNMLTKHNIELQDFLDGKKL